MPLYVADYLADTGHLSAAEHGAYLLMIMHYWQKGGLPDDERQLSRIARLSADEWAESRDTLAGFFGENWTHARIDEELAAAKEKYEKRAAAGRNGGKAKAGLKQCSSNATAGLNQPQPQPLSTVASATDADASPDWRDQLWRAGLYSLIRQTGKTEQAARQLLGKWTKAAGDDCRRVLLAIEQAETDRIGDPVAWITASLKPPDKPPKPLTQGESLRNMAREKGIIDATGSPVRRLETSDGNRENPGVGDVIRLAVSGNHGW